MMTWVLFRADTLGAARYYFSALIGFGSNSWAVPQLYRFLGLDVVSALVAGMVASGPFGDRMLTSAGEFLRVGEVKVGRLAGLAALFVLVTLSLAGGAYNPFIYFRF
jgi:alginate O-acetyltransferase complex protein AlgI